MPLFITPYCFPPPSENIINPVCGFILPDSTTGHFGFPNNVTGMKTKSIKNIKLRILNCQASEKITYPKWDSAKTTESNNKGCRLESSDKIYKITCMKCLKKYCRTETGIYMFTASIFLIAEDGDNWWMDKQNVAFSIEWNKGDEVDTYHNKDEILKVLC